MESNVFRELRKQTFAGGFKLGVRSFVLFLIHLTCNFFWLFLPWNFADNSFVQSLHNYTLLNSCKNSVITPHLQIPYFLDTTQFQKFFAKAHLLNASFTNQHYK